MRTTHVVAKRGAVVGTSKGAFIARASGKRKKWDAAEEGVLIAILPVVSGGR